MEHIRRVIFIGLAVAFAALYSRIAPAGSGEAPASGLSSPSPQTNIDEGRRVPYPEISLKGPSPEARERNLRELARILALAPEQEEPFLRTFAEGKSEEECDSRLERILTPEQLVKLREIIDRK